MPRKPIEEEYRYWDKPWDNQPSDGEKIIKLMVPIEEIESTRLGYGQHNLLLDNVVGLLKETGKEPENRDPAYISEKVRKMEDSLCSMAHDGMIRGIPSFCKEVETALIVDGVRQKAIVRRKWK